MAQIVLPANMYVVWKSGITGCSFNTETKLQGRYMPHIRDGTGHPIHLQRQNISGERTVDFYNKNKDTSIVCSVCQNRNHNSVRSAV
jgi:hypothetical protein